MSGKPVLKLKNPADGKFYTVKEAAKILKMSAATLYSRIYRGESLNHIWCPSKTPYRVKKTDGGEDSKLKFRSYHEQARNLAKIPSPTKFDKELAGTTELQFGQVKVKGQGPSY